MSFIIGHFPIFLFFYFIVIFFIWKKDGGGVRALLELELLKRLTDTMPTLLDNIDLLAGTVCFCKFFLVSLSLVFLFF
jgi:hypothetical protein